MQQATNKASLRVSSKATREGTRVTNRRLLLQYLFDGSEHSRTDLAQLTGLTAATVGTIIAELEESGLIFEVGPRRQGSQVGKPPTMMALCMESRNVISADLGDPTAFTAAVVDLGGSVVAKVDFENHGSKGLNTLDSINAVIERAIAKAEAPIQGIGIGTPGVVTDNGVVVEAVNLGLQDIDLAGHIERLTGYPTYVINDANAAAVAEYNRRGANCTNLAVVKIGSGVGAGLILNGQPYLGDHASSGEIGHLVVAEDGPLCRCGHRGCLETYVATPYLENALSRSDVDPITIQKTAAEQFGIAMAAVVALLNVDHILVSDRRDLLGDDFCEIAQASFRDRCLESVAKSVTLRYSSLGDDVVLLGAAGWVLSQELGVA